MVKQPTCVGLEEMRKGLSHLELLLILFVTNSRNCGPRDLISFW